MRIYKNLTLMLLFALTSIGGLAFSVATPIFLKTGDVSGIPDGKTHVFGVWIAMSVVGYFLPCVLFQLNCTKTAAAFSLVGTGMAIYIDTIMKNSIINGYLFDSSYLYLTQIFVSLLTVLYAIFYNWDSFFDRREKKRREKNKKAPSILDDEVYIPEKRN